MSFEKHMAGYDDLRTLYQIDALHAWRHGADFPPVHVEVSPTSRCNQRCLYCYTHRRVGDGELLKSEVLVRSFREMADAGVRAVLVQGTGEPLMHPAVSSAVRAGAERGLSVALCTNGVLFDPELQARMLEHLFYVRVSVVDSDPQRYARTHGCLEWQWDAVVGNLRSAVAVRERRGLSVGLCVTVYLTRENFPYAVGIVRFYREMGVDYIFVQEATYTECSPAGKEEYASAHFTGEQIGEMIERVSELSDQQCRVKVRFPFADGDLYAQNWRPDYCHGVKFLSVISSDGGVYPCWRAWGNQDLCYGSLYEQSFAEIWAGQRRRDVERVVLETPPAGDECKNCNNPKVNNILAGVRGATSRWRDFIV